MGEWFGQECTPWWCTISTKHLPFSFHTNGNYELGGGGQSSVHEFACVVETYTERVQDLPF
jgi:hypothetical protein